MVEMGATQAVLRGPGREVDNDIGREWNVATQQRQVQQERKQDQKSQAEQKPKLCICFSAVGNMREAQRGDLHANGKMNCSGCNGR